MEEVKIFLSYSHYDDEVFNKIIKHFKSLEGHLPVRVYCDRFNDPGDDYWDKILNELENSDIVCPLISVNYMNSKGCKKEREIAMDLKTSKGICIIPVILSACEWQEIDGLSRILALPNKIVPLCNSQGVFSDTRAKEVTSGVIKKIKQIQTDKKSQKIILSEEFSKELQDVGIFTQVFPEGSAFKMQDIFVDRSLSKYEKVRDNSEESQKISSNDLVNYSKILIAGDVQSGKTTLCKELFIRFKDKNLVPVYISVPNDPELPGLIENRIKDSYIKQYGKNSAKFENIKGKIVPIIDDFHKVRDKEKHILYLSNYDYTVIAVDDIFALNLKDEKLVQSYTHFKLREINATQKTSLVRKLISVLHRESQDDDLLIPQAVNYKEEDECISVVNLFLGRGIVPSHPFFILSVVALYKDNKDTTLDSSITSEGHCYQALIYCLLHREGVTGNRTNTHFTFLSEFAFDLYRRETKYMDKKYFKEYFLKYYSNKYFTPESLEKLLRTSVKAQIIKLDSLNNYSFQYPYMYNFFVAKHIVDNIKDREIKKEEIKKIIDGLHKDDNGYILVFINHHANEYDMLDEITKIIDADFEEEDIIHLTKNEVDSLDKEINKIADPKLIHRKAPEQARAERDKDIDKDVDKDTEVSDADNQDVSSESNADDTPKKIHELRRSLRTVEAIGHIIKNRAGSIEKNKLVIIFNKSLDNHLRILSSIIRETIKDKDLFSQIIEKKKEELNKMEIDEQALIGFIKLKYTIECLWYIDIITERIVKVLGDEQLMQLVEETCKDKDSPIKFIVLLGMFLEYKKSLVSDKDVKELMGDNFSEVSKKVVRAKLSRYTQYNYVKEGDIKRMSNLFKFNPRSLLRNLK
ncbi:MAG: TIR domain-containing protein [Gammaproteobacteria bacterium]|nr:TIR domain-containing protein [Gammaproteobacteria bacterium]